MDVLDLQDNAWAIIEHWIVQFRCLQMLQHEAVLMQVLNFVRNLSMAPVYEFRSSKIEVGPAERASRTIRAGHPSE